MILIPIKTLGQAKQRLSSVLDAAERRQLAEAMMLDVFQAIASSSAAATAVSVVTGDERARRLAQSFQFRIIEDAENLGESQAIAHATEVAERSGARSTLVLPADIPLLQAAEVDAILQAAPSEGAVLVPAQDGRGTNAILRTPPALFPLRFGNDSFAPHLAAARSIGKSVVVLRLAGVAHDVDRPEDLTALVCAPGTTRAQKLLRQWDLKRRPEPVRNG